MIARDFGLDAVAITVRAAQVAPRKVDNTKASEICSSGYAFTGMRLHEAIPTKMWHRLDLSDIGSYQLITGPLCWKQPAKKCRAWQYYVSCTASPVAERIVCCVLSRQRYKSSCFFFIVVGNVKENRCKLVLLETRYYTDKHNTTLQSGPMYLSVPQSAKTDGL